MKAVTVSLDYSSTDMPPLGGQRHSALALPLRVLDADGTVVAEGVASTTTPAHFDVSQVDGPAFVRLTWPSGKTQTMRVEVPEGTTRQVSFNDSRISRNEWSAWAVPRLGEQTSMATPEVESKARIDKFDRVWLRMWTLENSVWLPSRVEARASYKNDLARQLDFELNEKCRLLQLGGSSVPWRFVALPGGGGCRVLLTPNESSDPRADPLKVVVTGFRRDAETLLEFLARDSMRAVNSMGAFQPLATQLLADKTDDPISAVAGAYFLLRTEGWRRIPKHWFDNLFHMFPWLADPAAIRAVVMLRHGLADADVGEAVSMLQTCLQRGVPLFSEGLSLLQEASSVLRSASGSTRQGVFEQVEHLAASQAWAGAVLSFYGETPYRPSPEKVTGLPGQGRSGTRGKSTTKAATAGPSDAPLPRVIYLRDLK